MLREISLIVDFITVFVQDVMKYGALQAENGLNVATLCSVASYFELTIMKNTKHTEKNISEPTVSTLMRASDLQKLP